MVRTVVDRKSATEAWSTPLEARSNSLETYAKAAIPSPLHKSRTPPMEGRIQIHSFDLANMPGSQREEGASKASGAASQELPVTT